MEAKCSEAQGRRREAWSERSAEQTYESMNKNRMRGNRCRTSWQTTTKSISIKGAGCRFGDCVRKAVELTSGRSAVRLEIETEGGAIYPDRAAEVSRGHSRRANAEGPNGPQRGVKESGE